MKDVQKILGQVPELVRKQGTAREKLETIWRLMAVSRNGMQTRVAGDLADAWYSRRQKPSLPVDDPRNAARRLDRCLNGETAFPLDLAMDFIEVLPEPYRAAAKALVFQQATPVDASESLMDALNLDAQHDVVTDQVRFALAKGEAGKMSTEALEAAAMAFEEDCHSSMQVAKSLRSIAQRKRAH